MDHTFTKVKTYLDENLNLAIDIGKPIVLEEFGLSRDYENYDPTSPVEIKDQYYDFMFSYVLESINAGSNLVGTNFWAWGGEGRPQHPGAWWEFGDDLIGDPPQEL